MVALFWLVLLLSGCYFLVRRVDIFTLAYLSSAVYFLPAGIPLTPVPAGAYLIYFSVFLLLIAASFAIDAMRAKRSPPVTHDPARLRPYLRAAVIVYLPLLAYYSLSQASQDVTSKVSGDGGGLLYYTLSVVLGYVFVCALAVRRRVLVVLCLANYGWFVLTGDRTQFVIALLAAAVFFLATKRQSIWTMVRRAKRAHMVLAVALVLVGLFGKTLYGSYYDSQSGRVTFAEAFETRLVDSVAFSDSFEPYHVQFILASAIRNDDRISAGYLWWLPVQILPFAGDLGSDVHEQSEMVKQLYFSGWSDESGVSSNFFAEGFLLWGFAGALAFAVMYAGVLIPLASLIASGGPAVRLWASFGGVFWAFYIHRSSLFQIVSHEKRVIYSILIIVLLSRVLGYVTRRRKRLEQSL